jgi:hypothetical protein
MAGNDMTSWTNSLQAVFAAFVAFAIIGCISNGSAYGGQPGYGAGPLINGVRISLGPNHGYQGRPDLAVRIPPVGIPLYTPVQYPSPQYQQPPYPQPPQQRQQSAQGAAAERAFRQNLMMHSLGFGGIFGPGLKKWANTPSKPSGGGNSRCGGYNEYAAQQACKNGDGWAADRLENHESSGSEKDWYNR